jgi:aryl-alcohol dehydrogenase-like predicted oxidoreductase
VPATTPPGGSSGPGRSRGLAAAEGLTLLAYSPLLGGLYARARQPPPAGYDHPGNQQRLAVLREVAAELGATPSQVVLAWLMQQQPPIIPVTGASSVAQLEELLGAVDLRLDGVGERLDAAGGSVDADWADSVTITPP